MHRLVPTVSILAVLAAAALLPVGAASSRPQSQPQPQSGSDALPLEVAVSLRSHNGRSPVELSPDGQWIAHTVESADTVPRDAARYSATGFPFAEGDARMEATITNTATGESIRLGAADASSWAGSISPDGSTVAFYSDQSGEAGLWLWSFESRTASRVEGLIVRPFFGFEKPRWSDDGTRLLVKTVPEGMTVADANARMPQPASPTLRFEEVAPEGASVWVRSVAAKPDMPEVAADTAEEIEPAEETDDPEQRRDPIGDTTQHEVDLVSVDPATGRFQRLVRSQAIRHYGYSPDGAYVGYSVFKGAEPASQQPNYDLVTHHLARNKTTVVGENLRLSYGIEWSWSPDSRYISWIPSGQLARRDAAETAERLVLYEVTTANRRALGTTEAPTLDPGDGEHPPAWSDDSRTLFATAGGAVWRIDVASGAMDEIASVEDWSLRAMVSGPWRDRIWQHGNLVWAVGRASDGTRAGLFGIDPRSGNVAVRHEQDKTFLLTFNVAGSHGSGEIAYVATDLQSPADVWLFDTESNDSRRATRINDSLDDYALGEAVTLDWHDPHGNPLSGALLLPPDYEPGSPVPLVVWVYGGSSGSAYVNRFGLMLGGLPAFNMHVLATRGYAVLNPDAPVNTGSTAQDVVDAVMPGVNAAIAAGYADPDRLAVMGQSYGSYNTLSIITRTTRFKAAVITAAVLHPDLFADYLGGPGYYEEGQGNMGGSIWEYPDRYLENSPLFRFDQIETPLLIGQGETDGDLSPSEAIFTALQRLEKPVEYRIYQGEGHVITARANVLDFWRSRLRFFAEHMDLEVDETGRIQRPQP